MDNTKLYNVHTFVIHINYQNTELIETISSVLEQDVYQISKEAYL